MRIGFASKIVLAGLSLMAAAWAGGAQADEWRGRHDRGEHREIFFDDHYHHRHYYPSVGLAVAVLPQDSFALSFSGGRVFFSAGVWYRPVERGFVVVRPPLGVVVPVLPPGYSTLWAGNGTYYYANETYYAAAPNGYAVVAAPVGAVSEVPPPGYGAPSQPMQPMPPMAPPPPTPPPASAPAATAPPQAPGMWYYCASSKTYYPYVSECREGWRQVPATPPAR